SNSEHWYGFDQMYFRAGDKKPKVISDLKNYIQMGKNGTFASFKAFALQFKGAQQMIRTSDYMPSGWSPPYIRFEIDLKPNATTKLSQHETLLRLTRLAGA